MNTHTDHAAAPSSLQASAINPNLPPEDIARLEALVARIQKGRNGSIMAAESCFMGAHLDKAGNNHVGDPEDNPQGKRDEKYTFETAEEEQHQGSGAGHTKHNAATDTPKSFAKMVGGPRAAKALIRPSANRQPVAETFEKK